MELKKRKIDLAGFISLGLVRFTFYALVILLILLLGKIFVEGIGVISLNFLIDEPTNNMTEGGIGPAIFGTIAVTLLMVLFAVPLGVCSAIYLNEYAKDSLFTRLIRTSINNLAGVPSIVFGLFGLGFFILFIGKNLDSVLQTGLLFGQPALLWASATLAVLVLPIVIVSTLEALNSVPKSHRDASYGLGATKWQTIKNVVIPQARPGILTGTILAISRGAGETAPILFLGAAFFLPNLPVADICIGEYCIPMINPAEQFMYLAYHIFIMATQSSNPTKTLPIQYGSALVLIVLTFLLNITAIIFRYRFRKLLGRL
ncbi:MAG: phosphate ABC transporter permease PstA [Ignavibacteriota bacterium]|nr:MAG: phosphate ABC transporter permease PstA [Chlorobiota bacterium]MBE7477958.1 phosphate ABC transporter permease PstA [Ignavibacteriales bacterium]MBL1123511.1 phosphate ABC transporter permease PstA [Ignavibacteriota bacterium]MCC7094615.1 phosphate ABC transporter permease PstA [Ignavibacteriaceae bacterium]MCE7857049.1 phosphate ABC transporter permease PstA [Ignavibacteria bacterium CHB3]MEB2297511.1 phosphate ABC transporter permease PstA [Ignavibacteria bacterium]